MVELTALDIADPPEAWAELGFDVQDGCCTIGRVSHRLTGEPGRGIRSWDLAEVGEGHSGSDGAGSGAGGGDVDGLPTSRVAAEAPASPASQPPSHPNGALVIDHLVVFTPDLDRTVQALTDEGCRERRRRHAGSDGREMVQAFFRLGEVVLEVVGGPRPSGDGPARFFGLAFTVADLDATARYLGDRLHPAKDAVQPGRRIATLDRGAGSTVSMAFMSAGPVDYE